MSVFPPEYEECDENQLAQGDIFYWHDRHCERPWRVYGVIVTADCDLEWEKHGGRLSYIPALTTEDYLWTQWRPREFSASATSALKTVTIRINRWLEKNRPGQEALSDTAVQYMLQKNDADQLMDDLGVMAAGDRNNLESAIAPAVVLQNLLKAEKPDLVLLRMAHAAIKPASATDSGVLVAEFQKAIRQLPGDVFHLPAHPGGDDHALFLMLRHIAQCPATDVAMRPDDLRFGSARARRLGKIAAPDRYAVTQALAKVFADIGLPKSYEERCQSSAARFFGTKATP